MSPFASQHDGQQMATAGRTRPRGPELRGLGGQERGEPARGRGVSMAKLTAIFNLQGSELIS